MLRTRLKLSGHPATSSTSVVIDDQGFTEQEKALIAGAGEFPTKLATAIWGWFGMETGDLDGIAQLYQETLERIQTTDPIRIHDNPSAEQLAEMIGDLLISSLLMEEEGLNALAQKDYQSFLALHTQASTLLNEATTLRGRLRDWFSADEQDRNIAKATLKELSKKANDVLHKPNRDRKQWAIDLFLSGQYGPSKNSASEGIADTVSRAPGTVRKWLKGV